MAAVAASLQIFRPRWPCLAALLLASLAVAPVCGADAAGDLARLLAAAHGQVGVTLNYDPAYVRLDYPGGDVPADRGVCSDVVVRSLRGMGVDLQRLVHEDMALAFSAYPTTWGLHRADRNIDHRRVPNLERFFARKGKSVAVSTNTSDYQPGDIVSWRLPNGLAHIGVVSDHHAADGSARPLVIHNIGLGVREEDVLFAWRQVGHYHWFSRSASQ